MMNPLLNFTASGFVEEIEKSDSHHQCECDCNCGCSSSANKIKVHVSNVHELYNAVNNPANADKKIVLAAGIYKLDAAHPNAGRLEFQEDMELCGHEGHPGYVVIDASFLPLSSFYPIVGSTSRTGAIHSGKGCNTIKWLSVIGNSAPATIQFQTALSAIDTDLSSDKTHIKIEHLIIKNSQIGIDIRNNTALKINRVIIAEIYDNELAYNTVIPGGQGIVIQNSKGAHGATIKATLKRNYSHGNLVGIRVHNQDTNFASITIDSCRDRFEENGVGCVFNAGFDSDPDAVKSTANGNLLIFKATGTSVQGNNGVLPPFPTPVQGIYAVGGFSSLIGNRTSNNHLEMSLYACAVAGNPGGNDIYGAHVPAGAIIAGTSNIVNIHLYGISKSIAFSQHSSVPAEVLVPPTNIVNVF